MREYSTPPTVTIPPVGNLADDVVRNAEEHPDQALLARRDAPGGPWRDVTAAEFLAEVRSAARGLVAAGIEPGDRVLLLARTRYEWTVLDYAIWYAGAVSVPVYETSSAEQVAWVVRDSGARAAVVESPAHASRLPSEGPEPLLGLWVLDPDGSDGSHGSDIRAQGSGALAELAALGAAVHDAELEARRAAVTPADLATIIYTSGTTGPPRGCELTHGAFMVELGVTLEELGELFEGTGEGPTGSPTESTASTLLLLPMAHVFARIIQVGAVRARVRLGHVPDVRHLLDDVAEFSPTFLLGVPRIFEKIFNTASQRAASDGRGRLFDAATDVAIAWSTALERGRPGPLLRARHALYNRLVYARLREALGGRCRYAISGGAPLGERLGHFFRGVGITVLEGYGLTETTGAVTVNLPTAIRIGTVGRPLPGSAVRVADNGELLVRGGQVMRGYWGDSDATAEVLPGDGWLRTGDLGEIDDEGFVRITGRKKEILVTAGGKNVAPGMLEDRLRAHPLVDQCLVVGDGRPYVAALVTVDLEALEAWAELHGRREPAEKLIDDRDVLAELQAAVDATNRTVSQAEWIRRFSVLPGQWSEETGELTPSLKLRRNVVTRRYRRAIQELYD